MKKMKYLCVVFIEILNTSTNMIISSKFLFVCFNLFILIYANNKNIPIDFKDMKNLIVFAGSYTNARRGPATPQMKCVGYDCDIPNLPSSIKCINNGISESQKYNKFQRINIEWLCVAEKLNPRYELADIDVVCEEFLHRHDEKVLIDSCSIQYKIKRVVTNLVPSGQPCFENNDNHVTPSSFFQDTLFPFSNKNNEWCNNIIIVGALCSVLWIIFTMCTKT